LERNNLRNAFFNSNEIMEQRLESFKYIVKIESSYFAAGTYPIWACDFDGNCIVGAGEWSIEHIDEIDGEY
jgi:hypothetical protein